MKVAPENDFFKWFILNETGDIVGVREDAPEEVKKTLEMAMKVFNDLKDEDINEMRKKFLKNHEMGDFGEDVYYCDGDDDELDDESVEKLIKKYHIKFPDFLEDYDLDSMKPRYEKELKSE